MRVSVSRSVCSNKITKNEALCTSSRAYLNPFVPIRNPNSVERQYPVRPTVHPAINDEQLVRGIMPDG